MIFRWVMVALLTLEVIGHIAEIGEPRPVITRGFVIFEIIANGVLIYGMFNWL